ncbi:MULTISPECIES: isoprenylcysteine carboxylmethyltransferase family protein [Rhodopseudomonas]|uniref:Isoprenylcysteine carboxyl methyltransferase n=1 Tax=Rhodopseudomonas palustris TaxID=1076 RepID=A0A0D7ENH0_RHOPL|nr:MULTISPECIES: isoprenylcysteine carboxylmethyltransferase family protein [Rhodopseudomonas]KIZ42328.1 isoprenylcysteine carboxyl methyltransferase [Rhodopseudomonas palustris]MDF3812526.1 isoprenylcysteine carboxylmethyltransferase family protein [Rhodopseudomonas sp. BAL398]WOK17356.1 isoprenylcysteine carboxylmethyltransferase family protein [Rhodopseudomonas sp. BAL398]
MTGNDNARPNTMPWPPLVLIATALLAIALGRVLPLPALEGALPVSIGLATLLTGIALDLWAILTMRRARTNIMPHRAPDRLVTSGPFRHSRNPIYLANTLLLIGIGLAFGNAWFVLGAFVSAAIVDRLAIRREERHLAAKFGADWTAYAATTPRWLLVA